MVGYLHSENHCGMVDGQGIRSLFFLSGCPLRCLYCHNPDSWRLENGREVTAQELASEAARYKNFHKNGGGVTISGGEPFSQPEFLEALVKACKAHGMHTVIDTSGYATREAAQKILQYVDVVLLDFKAFDAHVYRNLTGVEIDVLLAFLDLCHEMGVTVWIRYVLVPGITDDEDMLMRLASFLRQYDNIKKISVLPFHKNGEYKWKELGKKYKLYDTLPPTPQQVKVAQSILAGGIA